MDKDLDDLLDSALDDFGKDIEIEKKEVKSEIRSTSDYSSQAAGKVTIEKTELYVDDIDYDDRPRSSGAGASSASSATANKKADNIDAEEQMRLFEEIFNDSKTRDVMKQFSDALNGFKEGNEAELIEKFEQVVSQLTSENLKLDDDDTDLGDFSLALCFGGNK